MPLSTLVKGLLGGNLCAYYFVYHIPIPLYNILLARLGINYFIKTTTTKDIRTHIVSAIHKWLFYQLPTILGCLCFIQRHIVLLLLYALQYLCDTIYMHLD